MIKLAKQLPVTALLLFFCYYSYSQSTDHDSTTIVVKIINNEKAASIVLSYTEYGASFARPVSHWLTSASETKETYRIKTRIPLLFDLSGNIRQTIKGIVYPGDSLIITCDYKNSLSPISFEGKSASACRYYSFLLKGCFRNVYYSSADISPSNYMSYFYMLKEDYHCRDSLFNTIKNLEKLPEWFISYQKTGLVYDKPAEMLKTIHTHNSLRKDKIYANPEFMLWFRDIPLNDPKAFQNNSYFDFLWQYFLWKNKIYWVIGTKQKVDIEWISKILPDVKRELKDITREWFLTKVLVNYYYVNDVYEVDIASSQIKPMIKSSQYIQELNLARAKSIELREIRFANAAKVGSSAPGFYLKDSLGTNYSIERFRGKWVLMAFYNSATFPNYFDSIKDSASKSMETLKLINIYCDYDAAHWKKVLNKHPDSGVHLFCKGNWAEMLTYLYGLESLPYFVLVDPDGVIRYSRANNYSDAFTILKNEI